MKQRFIKRIKATSMTMHNARNQAKIAIMLMAVIPALALFYVGRVLDNGQFTFLAIGIVFLLITTIARLGYTVLRKYPDNIMKLRQYITEVAEGTLPEKIALTDTQSSDDLKYIEVTFNHVLEEMRRQIETIEKQLRTANMLRETIEKQHQTLLEAERHRVMIQTLGAACHHIGQPATVLQIRLEFLEEIATDEKQVKEIKECVTAVQTISDILRQLEKVGEFRTVPYIHSNGTIDDRILAIGLEK